MHRIYDIMERIGKPQNLALSNALDIVYKITSIKHVRYIYHNLYGITSQLFCDKLITKDEMNMMIELFQEFCSKRIEELKVEKQSQEQEKKKFKFW